VAETQGQWCQVQYWAYKPFANRYQFSKMLLRVFTADFFPSSSPEMLAKETYYSGLDPTMTSVEGNTVWVALTIGVITLCVPMVADITVS
jgi:hypothetical protein